MTKRYCYLLPSRGHGRPPEVLLINKEILAKCLGGLTASRYPTVSVISHERAAVPCSSLQLYHELDAPFILIGWRLSIKFGDK